MSQSKVGYAPLRDLYSLPVDDFDGVTTPPGQQGVAGGQAGVVGVAGPVVADRDQRSAVGDEARFGGGFEYEGAVRAVVWVQVGDGRGA